MFLIMFIICYVISVCGEDSYTAPDFMGWTDKDKVRTLALVLLKDAKLKIRQISDIIDEHNVMVGFDVGVIIGRIREKYKYMMEVYREAGDRYAGRQTLQGPAVRIFRPLMYIISMEMIHMREVDIEKLVTVLQSIPESLLNAGSSDFYNETSTNQTLRTGRSIAEQIEEEDYKSQLREQYTMKKLGINKTGWAWDINSI